MNEGYVAVNYTRWAVFCICFIVVVIGTVVVLTNQANRNLEETMSKNGYEQGSLPGQTGIYWVKVKP